MEIGNTKKKGEENGYRESQNWMKTKSTQKWIERKKVGKEGWYTGNKLFLKSRSGTLEFNGRDNVPQILAYSSKVNIFLNWIILVAECYAVRIIFSKRSENTE